MNTFFPRALFGVLCVVSFICVIPTAAAQHPHAAPAVEKPAAAPRGDVKSTASKGYKTFTPDEPLTDWRRANDTVNAIGGWRVYAKEAARANKRDAEKATEGSKP
jgi:hypothetical protein